MANIPPLKIDTSKLLDAIEAALEPVELHTISAEILQEVRDARAKHGNQKHLPLGTGPSKRYLLELMEACTGNRSIATHHNSSLAVDAKALCEKGFGGNGVTWAHIIGEEFFEALAEEPGEKLEAELIQVAAMAISMIQISRANRRRDA